MSWGLLTFLGQNIEFCIPLFLADRCPVYAKYFGWRHLRRCASCAVLPLCPNAVGFAAVRAVAGLATIRSRVHCNRVCRNSEVVESYVAIVGGGPFGAAAAVECGEVEFVYVYGVVVA